MAKKTVASLQKKGAKSFTKAVKLIKNEASGSYSFKSLHKLVRLETVFIS